MTMDLDRIQSDEFDFESREDAYAALRASETAAEPEVQAVDQSDDIPF